MTCQQTTRNIQFKDQCAVVSDTDLLNDSVVSQSNSLLVNFPITSLVDQFSNTF